MSNKRIAIIGAGITGSACARLLVEKGFDVTVYEKESTPGGLVRCTDEEGNLFHRVGGHVFNTKDERVNSWFWSIFNEKDFVYAKRNAAIFMEERFYKYPIESDISSLGEIRARQIVNELMELYLLRQSKKRTLSSSSNFKDFLLYNFGTTLCNTYFLPYNEKIWQSKDLDFPLEWLDGKLPMPAITEILANNILGNSDSSMAHSTFFYPITNGSQYIVDTLLNGISITKNSHIKKIEVNADGNVLVASETYDGLVYTGDVRELNSILSLPASCHPWDMNHFPSNSTSNVLCLCDSNPFSWIYLPDPTIPCHRIIMTGNFSSNNNSAQLLNNRISCTVEFSGQYSNECMSRALEKLPFNMVPIAFNYEPNSYVINNCQTQSSVKQIKHDLLPYNIWLCGRFAEWKYLNMDAAIASAMSIANSIEKELNN